MLRIGVETAAAIAGLLLLVGAAVAEQSWWDSHFLPVFFLHHDRYVLYERITRLAGGAAGVAIVVFVRPKLGRLVQRMPPREFITAAARIALAIALALAASEWLLHPGYVYAAAESANREEPLRQPDRTLGWTFKPARTGHAIVGGRNITYAIDNFGYRVRAGDTPVNTGLPTLLFTGESIIAGFGLNWSETIPAQVGTALKMQSADIAVFGYANDQGYLRVARELPRFSHPVAVVSLFVPSLFVRNLGDDRPHLDSQLGWHPAVHRLWLSTMRRFFVPYQSDRDVERGTRETRAMLMATAALARKAGAIPLIVDPQFGPESPVEQMLRRRILDEPKMAYVRVMLDPGWHLKGDLHPDARAAHAIAMAIAARLQAEIARARSERHGE
jgi:hypothetical protein